MKQIIQDLKTGQTLLEEVPSPQVKAGAVLIKTTHSLVSLGSERMLVEFGKAGLIEKARQQPEKGKQVLDKKSLIIKSINIFKIQKKTKSNESYRNFNYCCELRMWYFNCTRMD